MTDTKTVMVTASGLAGICWSLIGQHSILLLVLFTANVLDYLTGIASAGVKGELSSQIGIKGVLKKCGFWVLVSVAIAIEYIMTYYMPQFGIAINIFPALTATVLVWLCVNETISILENLAVLGVPLPNFLADLIKKIKEEMDKKNK